MIVIIPIHNQVKNIDAVLTAYLRQTLMPKHIIMVCDRCTDSSYEIAISYKNKFLESKCILHVIDTSNYDIKGFGAGATRDVGLQYAMYNRLGGPYLFSDGDCIPSRELVKHHEEQLNIDTPRITCGLRYETVPNDVKADFPLLDDLSILGMPIQDDLRMNANWCKNLVFGNGYDRLVVNPTIFESSWICWSCNLGMNQAAIDVCRYVNGIIDGDINRVFNSSFDGKWGGEDGFVGLTMLRIGGSTVALSRRSYVTHIWHKRGHTNQEHLLMVSRKDYSLIAMCEDSTINADATIIYGMRKFYKDNFNVDYIESTQKIVPSNIMNSVGSLYSEPFMKEAIYLMASGIIRYKGAIPTMVNTGNKDDQNKMCWWAKSMIPWMQIKVSGKEISKAAELIPYGWGNN